MRDSHVDSLHWETDAAADQMSADDDRVAAPDEDLAGDGPEPANDAPADAGVDDAPDDSSDAPLWRSADGHVLHLPANGVERIIVSGATARVRPRPSRRFARRQQAIGAVGRIVRGAHRVGVRRLGANGARLPMFRSRVGGHAFRIVTRPRAGMRHEILSVDPESESGEVMEIAAPRTGVSEQATVRAAIQRGERDAGKLTNLIFFHRHPDRQGTRIGSTETALATEWRQIRDRIVTPALAPTPGAAAGPLVLGIDAAEMDGNAKANFVVARQKANIQFAIIRATEGTRRDSMFKRHWPQIKAAGLVRGAYMFLRMASGSKSPEAQANAFADFVGPLAEGDLPPALDVEFPDGRRVTGKTAAQCLAEVLRAWRVLKDRYHVAPIIYTSGRVWHEDLSDLPAPDLVDSPLWITRYPQGYKLPVRLNPVLFAGGRVDPKVPKPWGDSDNWWIHQYQGDGRQLPGFFQVDMNRFHTMSPGATGDRVTWVQRRLGIARTRSFDAATTAALRTFKQKKGIPGGDIVDIRTFAYLCSANPAQRATSTGELEEIEVPPAGSFDGAAFAARLGKEWSDRRKGNPPVAAMTDWLMKDYAQTMAGAKKRWPKGQYTAAALGRAWAISRVETMKFQLAPTTGVKPLVRFNPPPPPVALITTPLVKDSNVAPVAPLVAQFVRALRGVYKKPFSASNYRGHGGGSFLNRGFSIDLFLNNRDERGFYPPSDAVTFLRAVHHAAKAVGTEWRVLYNDFGVADAINRETGVAHVAYVGHASFADAKKSVVNGIIWHGPHPLILHFHLDLTPKSSGVDRNHGASEAELAPQPAASRPASSSAAAETAVRIAIVFGERDPNKLVNLAFFAQHPERNGRPLQEGEPNFAALATEWTAIKTHTVMPLLAQMGITSPSAKPAPRSPTRFKARDEAGQTREIAERPAGSTGKTIGTLVDGYRGQLAPEIPLPILLAFIKKESGGNFADATHGAPGNGWTSPPFYELGIFQTPAGLHGRCTDVSHAKCEFGPPGSEHPKTPSAWAKFCKKIGANAEDWTNPVTQVRVGLMDLETAAAATRRQFPELFPKKGSDWDLRMAVLYSFSRGVGAAKWFLTSYRTQLAALPENLRWAFLRDKTVTVTRAGGKKEQRGFRGENVESKMALAAQLGYAAT